MRKLLFLSPIVFTLVLLLVFYGIIIPSNGYGQRVSLSLSKNGFYPFQNSLYRSQYTPRKQSLFHMSHFESLFNFDGLFYFMESEDEKCKAYIQVFSNGIIESVSTYSIAPKTKELHVPTIETDVIEITNECLKFLKVIDVKPPIVMFLTFLNVRGFEIPRLHRMTHLKIQIDRNDLKFPKIILDDFEANLGAILRPAFDRLWNACGYPKSPSYDENGDRKKKA